MARNGNMMSIMEMVQKIRREWGANDAMRDAGLATPDGVERHDDIQYGNDKVWQTLDVYRPHGAEILPVIVSVHGGGWVYGSKEVYQYYCMSLCQRGFAVVNFNYRLAPESPYPAALEDTAAVFKWVEANVAQYGMDANNIFAVGDSAGANLLALYAAIYKENKLRAVGLHCGAYHGPMGDLRAAVCPNGGAAQMNAIRLIDSNFPPTFCMTATGDSLKEEAASLFRRLIKAGVPCVMRQYGTADNRLPHVFHVDIKRAEAAQCNDDVASWFKDAARLKV